MRTYSIADVTLEPEFPFWVSNSPLQPAISRHNHNFIEIVFVSQGYATHAVYNEHGEKRSYGLIRGDVFSIMPEETHAYEQTYNLLIYNITFERELFEPEINELIQFNSWHCLFNRERKINEKIHLSLHDRQIAEECMKKIMQELSMKRLGYRMYIKAAFYEFLVITGRNSPTEWLVDNNNSRNILDSISYMEKNPEKPITLNDLARKTNMSISNYRKRFREITGVSPFYYLIGLRLEKAHSLLENTKLPVTEIAEQCGFYDSSYLIRHFQKRYGITPAKYRQYL